LLLNTLAITLIGVAAIYSASQGYPGKPDYWLRQLYWLAIATGVGFVVLLVDLRTLAQWAYPFHAAVLLSLAMLLVLGGGKGGVDRWFMVGGIAVQPSEFAKFSSVLAIAYYFRDGRRVGDLGVLGLVIPLALVLAPFLLIVNQPDLGTALLVMFLVFPMIVLAGVRIRLILYMLLAGVFAAMALVASFQFGTYEITAPIIKRLQKEGMAEDLLLEMTRLQGNKYYFISTLRGELAEKILVTGDDPELDKIEAVTFQPYISRVLRPYQQKRLVTFLNPDHDPLGAGYHVIQSKIAIGSGGWTGKGFGNSTQGSLNFLPARHTDFIFSIYSEEWGLLGSMVLLGLYFHLLLRCFSIIQQTHDRFSAFTAMGLSTLIAIQVLINTGMAMGLLPVVGVPLPLFSYGGSSMVSTMISIFLLLNIRMRRFLLS
ncbi:MAG: rod shape-determining protein RodA, partial [Deltaproteobacteria bacterium]|nr:rod shape-determining protein RodA [Deltaproteobacteria bacterium]